MTRSSRRSGSSQVSLTYRGSADEAFRGASTAVRDLAKVQTDKERFARCKPEDVLPGFSHLGNEIIAILRSQRSAH